MKSKIIRITGSPAIGFTAKIMEDGELVAIGKGKSMSESKRNADRMAESIHLARRMK